MIGSVIALLQGGGAIVSGLNRLSSLRRAPDELRSLNVEVSDLKLVVHVVDEQMRRNPVEGPCSLSLLNALNKTKTALLDLEKVIVYDLTKSGQSDAVSKTAWFMSRGKVERMKNQIREAKMDLHAATSISN